MPARVTLWHFSFQMLCSLYPDFFPISLQPYSTLGPFLADTLQNSQLNQAPNKRKQRTSAWKISTDFGCSLAWGRMQFQAHVQIFELTDSSTDKEAGVSGFKHFLVCMAADKVPEDLGSYNQGLWHSSSSKLISSSTTPQYALNLKMRSQFPHFCKN